MTDSIESAWAEYRRQQAKVAKQPTFAQQATGTESAYAAAYQVLVRLGEVPQLRKKYR